MDLVLVLDGSESISWSQFDVLQAFASDLAGEFEVGPADVHIGIVQFAGQGQGRTEVDLSGDPAAVQAAVASMEQIIGVTDIQEGLLLGQALLNDDGRDGVPHVMVLLTDGEHNEPGDPYAEADSAKAAGTEIFAIAVGNGPKLEQLNSIVTEPVDGHVISVDDFSALVTILQPLVEVVCPPTPTPTLPSTDAVVEPTSTATPTPAGTSDDVEPTATEPSSSTDATPGDNDNTDGRESEVRGVSELPVAGSDGTAAFRRPQFVSPEAAVLLGVFVLIGAAGWWVVSWRGR
jgi:hypothetical protein